MAEKNKKGLFEESFDNLSNSNMIDKIVEIQIELSKDKDTLNDIFSFNRYRFSENNDFLIPGTGYVFMTKPNLFLMSSSGNSDVGYIDSGINCFAQNLLTMPVGKLVIQSLSQNVSGLYGLSNRFIPAITNNAEINFETKDISLTTESKFENYSGQKITFGGNKYESEGTDNISMTYVEYDNMYFTYLHKLWVDYIHDNQIGKFLNSIENIKNNVIEYMSSVYFFLVGLDGSTIKYFSKYTGVFPNNVPYSALSHTVSDRNVKKLPVTYTYNFKEDLDPQILIDFNYVSKGLSNIPENESVPKDKDYSTEISRTFVDTSPFIIKSKITNQFHLLWSK